MRKHVICAASVLVLAGCSHGSQQLAERSNIYASGSSTVFPFTMAIAAKFQADHPGLPAPKVEQVGTVAGIQKFCGGVGSEFPDIADASRAMRPEEAAGCREHGVRDFDELQIGLDGIAFVQSPSAPKITLTPKQIYEALAATPYGQPQTAHKWKDIDPSLPDIPILVYGPTTAHGTRDALAELILKTGCESDKRVAAMTPDKAKLDQICTTVRTDGAYVNEPADEEKAVISMIVNPGAIGIVGYSFLEHNAAKVRAVPINGVLPSIATVQSGKYAGARPLYIYVKKAAVEHIAGMKDFISTYAASIAPGGYLAQHGLIPADKAALSKTQQIAAALPDSPAAAPAKS